jgi:hypothetical protein
MKELFPETPSGSTLAQAHDAVTLLAPMKVEDHNAYLD